MIRSAKPAEEGFYSSRAYSDVEEDYNSAGLTYGNSPLRQEDPPEYSTNATSQFRTNGLVRNSHFPSINFSQHLLPRGTLSDDRTTRTTTDPELLHNAEAVFALLQEQVALPPKPIVRIKGTHIDKLYSWGTTRTDFDLTLDLTPLILPTTTCSSYMSVEPVQGYGGDVDPLRSWAQRFCDDPDERKSFTLERILKSQDRYFLERHIRSLIFTTKYKGDLTITFPIRNTKVVIESPNISTAHRELSETSGIKKWISRSKASSFDLEVAKMTTKLPSSRITNHLYKPIQVIWPYAADAPSTSMQQSSSMPSNAAAGPQAAIPSQEDWWHLWEEPIRNGVLAKKQGWVTIEDWQDVALDGIRMPEPRKSWGNLSDDMIVCASGLKLAGARHAAPGDVARVV